MTGLLVFGTILICSCWGFPVDEQTYRRDIDHLQEEVNLLKANLTAVWEKLHEHDEMHAAHVTPTAETHPQPIRSVIRENRRYRVRFNFFMDIPDHPGQDGAVVVQEYDSNHPLRSVLRETRDFNVTLNFFLDAPEHHTEVEPTPVRTAVRQNSRWRVHFNIFLDIPEHPGQPGAVTTQALGPRVAVSSVMRETRRYNVNLDFFVDAENRPEPVRSVVRESLRHNVHMDFFVDIPDQPGYYPGAIIPVFNGTSPIRSVTRETRRHIVHFDFFMDIPEHPQPPEMHYAHCEMESNPSMTSLHHHVHGSIRISQQEHGPVRLDVNLSGFNTSEDEAGHRHGLQIHEYGDMEHGCGSIGELYHNEHAPDHANPGDLGDLVDDVNGTVHTTRSFDWLQVDLAHGILGRSLAILQGDHNHPDSQIIACCIIGRAQQH